MTALLAEYFTDPLSPWCWAAQPTIRRLQYAFDDLELVPRLTLRFPEAVPPDGLAAEGEVSAERATAAIRSAGMPVADDLWADGRPSSRLPSAAVAVVRETATERVDAYLRRVRETAFATGESVDTVNGLRALADAVGGIDATALAAALEDGRATAALAEDIKRASAVAAELDDGSVEVRGEVGRLPVDPRLEALGVAEPNQSDGGETNGESDDIPERGGEDDPPTMVAPPSIRFQTDDRVIVADPRIGFQRLGSVGGRAIPDHVESLSDKYGTGRLAMHLPRDVAESLSSREFVDEIRAYVARFERACLAEIAAGTGRSPETCRGCLQALADAGVVEPIAAGDTWRMIEGGGSLHPKG